jgi:hypothetical protein
VKTVGGLSRVSVRFWFKQPQGITDIIMKRYFQLGDVFYYFIRVFKKKDPNAPDSFNLRIMHGINKISIIMFLICLIVMITRAIMR